MSGILPSQQAIEAKLLEYCKAAPGRLQSVGEDFLAARNPSRYRSLRPQGRNSALQTTKGYPDAYSFDGDGGVNIVEATVTDWRGHIEKADVVALTKIPKITSYVLFVLERRAEPLIPQKNTPDEKTDAETHCRNLLIGAGVPSDEIELIFLNQLVRELRSTRYAHILADIGLATRVPPFTRVLELPLIQSASPTLTEYQEERVVSPQRLDALYELTRSSRTCVLVGLGGVGKTTLALSIAHRWMARNLQEAYYLDVKRFGSNPVDGLREMLVSMEMYFDTKSLFIVDNSHLFADEELAQLLILAANPKAPRLLLLGRRFAKECSTALSAADRARIAIAPVEVEANDLLAAYTLFSKREVGLAQVTLPTLEELQSWHRTAPDLVLFCAALQASANTIRAGLLPTVSRKDAEAHVRKNYLDTLPPAELPSLIVIAKLATLEIAASRSSLIGLAPLSLIARDLVAVTSATTTGEERFSLPHDNLGALVLANIDPAELKLAFEKAVAADIFQATYIVRRLLDTNDVDSASRILNDCHDQIWKFHKAAPPSFAAIFDRLYVRAGLPTTHRTKLVDLYRDYVNSEAGFLTGSASFLVYAERLGAEMKELDQVLLDLPADRLNIAMRLASPVELVRLLELFARFKFAIHAHLESQMKVRSVQEAFANNLIAANPDEVNQALGGLHVGGEKLFAEIISLLGSMKLDRLFEGVRGTLHRDVRYILRLKSLVEFLASTTFREELADQVARSFKNIMSLTADYSGLGYHSRKLVGDALARTASLDGKYVANPRRAAAGLVQVLQGCTDTDTIKRFVDQLPSPIAVYLRFLREPQLEALWRQLLHRFPDSNLTNSIRIEIKNVARERYENALSSMNIPRLAVARHLWRCVGEDETFRDEEVVALLDNGRSALMETLERLRTSKDGGKSKFYMVQALQFELDATRACSEL